MPAEDVPTHPQAPTDLVSLWNRLRFNDGAAV